MRGNGCHGLTHPLHTQLTFGRLGQVVEDKKSITLKDISEVGPILDLDGDMVLCASPLVSHGVPISPGPTGGAQAAEQHAGLRGHLHALCPRHQPRHLPSGGIGLRLQQAEW